MVTLQNDAGVPIDRFSLSYDLAVTNQATESIPGHLVYFSLTGETNSWVRIPSLSEDASVGHKTVALNLDAAPWLPGDRLYILWADDNALNPDTILLIDNFAISEVSSPGQPPTLILQPQSQAVEASNTAVLTAAVVGTFPLRHQWRFLGTNIPAATNAALVVSNVQSANEGPYDVVVTNNFGAVTSVVATLSLVYSLVLNTDGGGAVVANPSGPSYALGTQVTLTAVPNSGLSFAYWSGAASGTNNPLLIEIGGGTNVMAHFGSAQVSVAIVGAGSVSRTPNQAAYGIGETVTLTATLGRWHFFDHWGDNVTTNPRVITIAATNNYTAIFSPTTQLETLTFSNVTRTAPVGMPALFVDGQFIVNGTATRLSSAQVSMLTTFTNGSIFFTLDGTAPSFISTLYVGPFALGYSAAVRAIAYNASFASSWEADPVMVIVEPTYIVDATTPGGGSIATSPAFSSYTNGALVTLTATSLPGWTFLRWLGDASGTNPSNTVRVTRDMCMQALFGTGLGTTVAGNGSVLVDPVAPLYPYGTVVRLTGLPQAGSLFAAWGNAASSTNNPLIFPVTNANPTVSSVFGALSAGQAALAVVVNGQGRVTVNPRGNRFNTSQTVTLTATPDADQSFLGWSGDASGLGTNLVVVMNQSKVIAASFTSNPRFTLGPCRGGLREGGYQFTLTGNLGAHYQIDSATTLPNWTPLVTITNAFGTVQFTDASATNGVQRFYRARILP